MALSNDERQALIELKNQGYSYSEAMGFIASSRLGETSRVERELSTPEEVPSDDSFTGDLKAGFQGAQDAFQGGLDRDRAIEEQDRTFVGEKLGKFAGGVRTAGDMFSSLVGGAIRAVPGGTTVMNSLEKTVSEGAETVAGSELGQDFARGYRTLPEGVRRNVGDVGNIAMGSLGLSEGLLAPGASRAIAQGVREFSQSGVTRAGQTGISQAAMQGLSPEDLMQRVARISKGKQAAFEDRAGESVGSYLVNRGIFGDPEDITTQLYDRMKTSKGRVDAGLAQVDGRYQNDSVLDALEQLAERERRVSSSRTPSPDQARVNTLLRKHKEDGLTLAEVNEVKRLYERNVKLDFLRDNVSDKIALANNIDRNLRLFVEKTADERGFPNVRELNRETMLAKQLLDDLGAEYAGQQGNNYVSLSDAFFLAEAASNPTALAAFGLKRAFSAKSSMSAVARLMSRNRQRVVLPDGTVREQLRLPEAGRSSAPRDRLGLPEPTSDFQGVPIRQPRDSQSTIDARERARIDAQRQAGQQADQDAFDQSFSEMEADLSGNTRTSVGDNLAQGIDGSYYRFNELPSWIPTDLRDGDLLNRVLRNIREGRQPRANAGKEKELQDIVANRIQQRAEQIKKSNADDEGIFDPDVAFGIAIVGGGTYFMSTNDGEILPVLAIGMMAAMPGGQRQIVKVAKETLDNRLAALANLRNSRTMTNEKPNLKEEARLKKEIAGLEKYIQELSG